jgi:Holliday junction resolvase RusA-like endonuclease
VRDGRTDGVRVPRRRRPGPAGQQDRYVAGKRAIVVDANKSTLKPWRQNVAAAAREAYQGERIEGPVLLVVEFGFLRPKSVKREYPTVKPDLDKLERALLDGITDSGLWRDDSQVVSMPSKKVYADRAGVHVQIGEFTSPTHTKERTQ